jgi:hypothetical protein
MEPVFNQSVFKFNDFGKYSTLNIEVGGNIGYRLLISFLEISSIAEPLPIFLAFIINIFVDIGWIYLLSKYLSLKGLILFILMLGLQPYAAIYTLKFTTIIFAKIALFFFCKELFDGGFNKIKQKTLSLGEFLFWTFLTLMRTANVFSAVPYFFLKLRNHPFRAILIIMGFGCAMYFASPNYVADAHEIPDRPWGLNYIKELLGIENNFLALLLTVVARVLLLFGAREKLLGEGIEQFLVWGIPGLELSVYVFLGVIQFFGFYLALRFFFQRYGVVSLAILIPIGIYILTYPQQRYLIPFIPICLFGLALAFENVANNFKKLKY